MFARECKLSQRTASRVGIPQGTLVCPRYSVQAFIPVDGKCHQPIALPGHAIEVIPQSQIECERGTDLPVILEECAPFVLMIVFGRLNQSGELQWESNG